MKLHQVTLLLKSEKVKTFNTDHGFVELVPANDLRALKHVFSWP